MRVLITAIISLTVGIIFTLVFPYYSINPGVLSEGHNKLKENCFACHSLTQGAVKAKCISCHNPKTIGIKKVDSSAAQNSKSNLIHSVVAKMNCADCHKEHKGTPLESARTKFSHDLLPNSLIQVCNDCHFLARPKDDLHTDIQIQCGTCHSIDAWKPANFVNHSKYFLFDNDHPAKCMNCHNPNESFKNYTCYKCHEHNEAKLISEHSEEGIRDIRNCVKCHRSSNKDDVEKEGRGEEKREGEDHSEEDDH